jgi:ribose transport system ATP-binding protein
VSPEARGRIELAGKLYEPRSPAHAIGSGIGLQPEDRKTEGLMMQMSVLENASLSVLDRIQRFRFILRGEERRRAGAILSRMRLKAASPDTDVGTLSGGNQQKVLLGRWLLVDPRVLILDDPTRGIDIGAKRDIYEVIDGLTAGDKGVILISSELPELLACSDRILVLSDGECVATLDAHATAQEEIMRLATRTGG